ncbi:MAG: glycoside hydrolase family 18, partial [Bacteroidaceae bacterium]
MKRYNLKSIILRALPMVLVGISILSCSDWTDVEVKAPINKDVSERTPEYYEQLRAFKMSDHAVTFGWYGNWTGKGACLSNCLASLPDSTDFISLWGCWKNPSEDMKADLKYVQEVKGTRAMICWIVDNCGAQLTPASVFELSEEDKKLSSAEQSVKIKQQRHDFWGWKDGTTDEAKAAQKLAIEKYAEAIMDTINKYNYDGFDLDLETHWGAPGEISSSRENLGIFSKALAKELGPKSGTGRLLVVDCEPDFLPAEVGEMYDYFICQTYRANSNSKLEMFYNKIVNNYKGVLTAEQCARKYIVTETFEEYALTGGTNFTTADGTRTKSLEGMALWNPVVNGKEVRKGGVGT